MDAKERKKIKDGLKKNISVYQESLTYWLKEKRTAEAEVKHCREEIKELRERMKKL